MIILVLFLLPFTCGGYTLTCPTKEQWSIRSSSWCKDRTSYYCLLDLYTGGYREKCLPFPSRDTKGYKKVFAGNVDGIECTPDTYQPFKFWTNESSDCVYKKSLCTEEGQVVQDDGSNEVDRRCRCDYRHGYNYVTKPRNICNCVPSEEDCSCYRMSCPQGQLLTPDYECRNVNEWKQTFGCPDITSSLPDGESTVIVAKVTPKDTEHTPAVSRNAAPLFVLTCLLLILTIGLLVLWTLCKPFKHEENIEIKTVYIDTPSEVIPQNIRESQQKIVEKWKIKDDNFVPTKAALESLKSIRKNQCVIITGPLGCGKTFTAQHVILQIMEQDGYGIDDLLLVIDPNDIKRYAKGEGKQILFIDDIFGKYSISQDVHEWWSRNCCLVEYFLKKNSELKIVATSRSDIYNLIQFTFNKSHFTEVSFLLEELSLCIKERRQIGEKHLGNVIDGLSDEVLMRFDFFPALCSRTSRAEPAKLDTPVKFIGNEITKMHENLDTKFLTLALLVISMNNIKLQSLYTQSPVMVEQIVSISREIGLNPTPSLKDVQRHVVALKGSLVKEDNNVYSIKTDKLFDIITCCISSYIMESLLKYAELSIWKDRFMFSSLDGHPPPLTILIPRNFENLYFDRMLAIIRSGSILNVFSGIQKEYRTMFIEYLKDKFKVEDLCVVDENKASVLHVVVSQGYDDFVDFFINIDKSIVTMKDADGRTPLHLSALKGHALVTGILINANAPVDERDNEYFTPLDLACIHGHSETVSILLANKSAIKQNDETLNTALHLVCQSGNENLVVKLLHLASDKIINMNNKDGQTPLHIAVKEGFCSIVEHLIKYNANIDFRDNKCRTPLFFACEHNHIDLVKLLLEHKASPIIPDENDTLPLQVSCEKGYMEVTQLLSKTKINVNYCDKKFHNSALYRACKNGHLEIVDFLLIKGADVNIANNFRSRPIHTVCKKGYTEICAHLLDYKAEVNCVNKAKDTPLHLACEMSHLSIVEMLLNNNASVELVNKDKRTALHLSCITGNITIAKLLLKQNPELIHMKDKHDMTPLVTACEYGQTKVAQTLINHGSEINFKTKDGVTPLIVACRECRVDIVQALLNAQVDVCDSDLDLCSPLYIACSKGNEEIAALLIKNGALVIQTQKDGDSPLHLTSALGNMKLTTFLVKHQACVNHQNKLGETPLWKAALEGHLDIVKYLCQCGAKVNLPNKKGKLLKDHPRIKQNKELIQILSR